MLELALTSQTAPWPLLDGAKALLEVVKGVPAAKLALDLLGAAVGLADPAPVLRAAVAILEPKAALPVLRFVETDEDRRRAAGA